MGNTSSQRVSSRGWLLRGALVLVVAFAVKFAYLHERVQLPDISNPTLDSLYHDQWARGLAFGDWAPELQSLREQPFFRAPLYPYFMSLVYRAFGTDAFPLFVIQHLLGSLTVVLLFYCSIVLFNERIAWIAVALQLAYWPFTYHESERLIPALSLFLDAAFLVSLVWAGRVPSARRSALAGALAGLSAIARPSILIVLPVAVIWVWKKSRRASCAAVLLGGAALVIVPVTLRNAIVGHDAVLIASQGGVNFFIGNNPESNGTRAVVPGTRADWWGGFKDTQRIAEEDAGHALRASEVSDYWYRRGLAFLVSEPAQAARLYAKKAALLLGNAEPSNEGQLYFRRGHSNVLSAMRANFAFILALCAVGCVEMLRRRPKVVTDDRILPLVLAATYAVGILLFFVTSRYRLPVALFLIPVSAAGCAALYDLFRARVWRRALAPSLVFVGVFAASMWNPFQIGSLATARGEYGMGVDYFEKGDYRSSLDALDRSLAADPEYAPAWMMRGRAHVGMRQTIAGIQDLRTACRLDSTLAEPFLWLGVAYQKAGRHGTAEHEYLKAMALDPDNVLTLNNLADVYLRQNRVADARTLIERALAINPSYPNAIFARGYLHELEGRYQEAADDYRRAMPYPPARARLNDLEKRLEPR